MLSHEYLSEFWAVIKGLSMYLGPKYQKGSVLEVVSRPPAHWLEARFLTVVIVKPAENY